MRFEREFVQQVEAATDLVSLIQDHGVVLKKAGGNYKGCCPFHSEKTPSFNVNPQRNFYHCFGCGVGGGPLKFLMDHDRLGFVEAVEDLAQRSGIALPERTDAPRRRPADDPGLRALTQAAAFYEQQLSGTMGGNVRRYLAERMVPEAMWSTFRLGYAPDDWRSVLRHLEEAQCSEEVLLQAGLIKQSERSGRAYDRFRNRLMFPIRDLRGRVIGFGGRIFGDAEGPKYLNSPESEYYHKSQVLYGLYEGLETIRSKREMIFVEGYLDVIRLHEYGIRQAVAPCGTALTEEHVALVARYADRAVLVFDGDDAGRNAALKSCALFLGKRLQVEIVTLPPQEDPDTLLLHGGAPAFEAVVQQGQNLVDFWVERTLAKHPDTPQGKVVALEALLADLQPLEESPLKQLLLQSVGDRLRLDPQTLGASAKRLQRAPENDKKPSLSATPAVIRDEYWILQAMLTAKHLATQAREQLQADDFQDPRWQKLFLHLVQLSDDELSRFDPIDLEPIHPDLSRDAMELLAGEFLETHVEEQFHLSLGRLKERALQRRKGSLEAPDDWEQRLQSGMAWRQEWQRTRRYRHEPRTSNP